MNDLDERTTEQWEVGDLGRDAAYVRRVPAEIEAEVDHALAMKLVTMRLPVPMIEALKVIANFYGIGYQPMVRDLLGRFIRSEVPTIMDAFQREAGTPESEKTAPVNSFMEKRSACG